MVLLDLVHRLDPSLLISTIHCVKCYSGTKGEDGSVVRNTSHTVVVFPL
jgi:hypothetical protein